MMKICKHKFKTYKQIAYRYTLHTLPAIDVMCKDSLDLDELTDSCLERLKMLHCDNL